MSETKQKNSARQIFTSFLEQRKLRKTPERFAILDEVFTFNDHFDVETLLKRMESSVYRVSRATIYNSLELFVEAGLVRRHQFDGKCARFERVGGQNLGSHYHLVCRSCGKVKEVRDSDLTRILEQRVYRTFTADYFALYVYGLCSTCQRKARKEARRQQTSLKIK